MKKTKTLIVFVFSLLLSLSLFACGTKGPTTYKVTCEYNLTGVQVPAHEVVVNKGEYLEWQPVVTGYDFGGWTLDRQGLVPFDAQNTPIVENITVYAKWNESTTPVNVTFDFDHNGKSQVVNTTVGASVQLPDYNGSKNGYIFTGWIIGTETVAAGEYITAPLSAMTYYAKWEKGYTVSFDKNGGNGTTPEGGTYLRGNKITLPSQGDMVNGTKTFAGWTDGVAGSLYVAGSEYRVTDTVVLKAVWGDMYAVSYNLAGGTGGDAEDTTALTGSYFTLPNGPEKDGFLFVGWSDGVGEYLAGDYYMMGGAPVNFTAVYETAYDVVYHYNYYDDQIKAQKGDYLSFAFGIGAKLVEPEIPARTDHVFDGWFEDEACTDSWDFKNDKVQGELHLYAKWHHNYYTFTRPTGKPDKWEIAGRGMNAEYPEMMRLPSVYEGQEVIGVRAGDLITGGVTGSAFSMIATVNTPRPCKYIVIPTTYEYLGHGAFNANYWVESYVFADPEYTDAELMANDYELLKKQEMLNEKGGHKNLKTLGVQAFYSQKKITKLDIPGSVTSIGTKCFLYCELLETIDFNGANINAVPDWAFARCYSLVNLEIDWSKVTSYGEACFNHTQSYDINKVLTNLNPNVKKLPDNFYSGSNIPSKVETLTDIVRGTYTIYWSEGGIKNNMDVDMSATALEIPAQIEELGYCAFAYATNVKTLTFATGSKLKEIGQFAFDGMLSLESVALPASLQRISMAAFFDCKELKSVTWADDGLSEYSGLDEDGNSVRILKIVDSYAFLRCNKLESVTLPATLKQIGYYAFSECHALTTFTFPEELETVWDYCFSDTPELASISFNEKIKELGVGLFNESGIESIVFPKSLEFVGDFFFYECPALKSVKFEEGSKIKALNSWFCYVCPELEVFELPASLDNFNTSSTATGYVVQVFTDCPKLTTFSFPDGASSNEKFVIENGNVLYSKDYKQLYMVIPASNIVNYTVNSATETIMPYAFYQHDNLKSVFIPKSVKLIRYAAFRYCLSIESIVIEDGSQLEEVQNSAFANNNVYKNDDYTAGVIEKSTLKEVVIGTTTPPMTQSLNVLVYSTGREGFAIYVPDSAVDAYKRAPGWGKTKDGSQELYKDYIKPMSSRPAQA